MYIVQNKRIVKPVYITSVYGTVIAHQDMGPYLPRRSDRALLAMSRMERMGQTDRRLYSVARRVACAELGWNVETMT